MSHADRWNVVELNLSDLKPHPQQQEFFAGANEAEDESLAEDFKARGQQNPIEGVPEAKKATQLLPVIAEPTLLEAWGGRRFRRLFDTI